MDSLLQFDVTHAYLVVFAAVLLDVIALPLIAMPVLLMAGGLAATGKVSLLFIIGFATVAAAAGDTLWYSIGRYGSPHLMAFMERTGGKGRSTCFAASDLFRLRRGISCRLKICSWDRFAGLPSGRHRKHVRSRFLLMNGRQPNVLGASVACLGYSGIRIPRSCGSHL
jgi:hypothetical protein